LLSYSYGFSVCAPFELWFLASTHVNEGSH
jgi:hypothetical protein